MEVKSMNYKLDPQESVSDFLTPSDKATALSRDDAWIFHVILIDFAFAGIPLYELI